jgi:hypothetical protein
MATYFVYIENILSSIVKNFTESETELNNREKSKDYDIESLCLSPNVRPISVSNKSIYLKDNDDNV